MYIDHNHFFLLIVLLYCIKIVISKIININKASFIKKLYVLLNQYLLEVFELEAHIIALTLHFPIGLFLEHFLVHVI